MSNEREIVRDWICEGDSLSGEIAEAVAQAPPLKSMTEWLTWWWKAERFRRATNFAVDRILKEAKGLADVKAVTVLDECSEAPSVVTATAVLRGFDAGLLAEWERWCEGYLMPMTKADLLPRAAIGQLSNRAAVKSGEAAFARHAEWGRLSGAFERLGAQFREDALSNFVEWVDPAISRNRKWCLDGFRHCEKLIYLGVEKYDPTKVLADVKAQYTSLLSKELTKTSETGEDRVFGIFNEAERHGISAWRVVRECRGAVEKRGVAMLKGRDEARASERLAFARARLLEIEAADRSSGGQVTFKLFREGVAALAEANALGAVVGPDLLDRYAEWRGAFEKLERLRILSLESGKYCESLKGRGRSLRTESLAALEKYLEEVSHKGDAQRAQFHSTKGNLVSQEGKTKTEMGENGYLPAKQIINREIRRRRRRRVQQIVAAAAAILITWIAIDTYLRASSEADRRIEDLVFLRQEASIELVEEALVSAEATSKVEGLFRLFPKWKQEVGTTNLWIDEQRALSVRLDAILASLRDFRSDLLPFPGIADQALWNAALQNWSQNESIFVDGRKVIAVMAPGVARPGKGDFAARETEWGGELTFLASGFEEEVQTILKSYQSCLDEGVKQRNEPDVTALIEQLRHMTGQLDLAITSFDSLSSQPSPLQAFELVRERAGESVHNRKADAEVVTAHLTTLGSDLEKLGGSSGLPTYVRNLEPFLSVPSAIETFLPQDLSADAKTVHGVLSGASRFDELVFKDFSALGKLPVDPPVPSSVAETVTAAMINLLDDWKLKDIVVWRDKPGGTINAYSRDRPVGVSQNDGSKTWTVDAYIPANSLQAAEWPTFSATDSSGGNGKNLVGEFPKGRDLSPSRESAFFASLDLHLVYSTPSRTFKNSLFHVLDKLIANANAPADSPSKISLVMLAYLHQQLGKVIAEKPEAWGAELTSFSGDFTALNALRKDGLALDIKNDDWMVPEFGKRWKTTLEVFYLGLSGRSYAREYAANVNAARSISGGGGFEFAGFLELNGKANLKGAVAKTGRMLWGVREEPVTRSLQAAPAFKVQEDGTYAEVSRVARFSPLFMGSEAFQKFFDEASINVPLGKLMRYE